MKYLDSFNALISATRLKLPLGFIRHSPGDSEQHRHHRVHGGEMGSGGSMLLHIIPFGCFCKEGCTGLRILYSVKIFTKVPYPQHELQHRMFELGEVLFGECWRTWELKQWRVWAKG